MTHNTRIWTVTFSLALALGGCGERVPASPTDGATDNGGQQQDSRWNKDACVRPPGGCFSSSDCAQGYECQGCGGDPCCPACTVCYGKCVPKTGGCSTNAQCDAKSYCHHATGSCGKGATLGICKKRPEGCYTVYNPVCGCDDKTYGNDCMAFSAGVSNQYVGECKQDKCVALYKDYAAIVKQAKVCCPMCNSIQCTKKVPHQLACGCDTYVQATNTAELQKMTALEQAWTALGCAKTWACPGVACPVVTGASCVPDTVGSGTCQDLSTGP